MIAALFSVLLLAAEIPASTPETTSTPTANATAAKEKKICRVDPADTGTRLPKRLCRTQSEWNMQPKGRNAGDLTTAGAR